MRGVKLTQHETKEKEERKEARQEEKTTNSCDLVSHSSIPALLNVPIHSHLSVTYKQRCQEAEGEKHL